MPQCQAGAAALLRSLFLAGLLGHGLFSEGFHPHCTTDFATELVCHWNMVAATNCTHEVRLLYAQEDSPHRVEDAPLPSVCIPENERGSDSTPQCICSISRTEFRRTWFFLALEVNGTRTGPMAKMEADKIVKPRPLVNLTADTKKSDSVVLTWAWDAVYAKDNDLHLDSPTYDIAYWPEGQQEKRSSHQMTDPEKQSYPIFVQRLSPGPYVASVRVRIDHLESFWSDWSNPCKFHVESRGDKLWLLILWLCALVMAVIFASYYCVARLKRNWWDSIPNPAKSKVTEDMTRKPLSAAKKIRALEEGKAPLSDRQGRDYENFPGSLGAAASPGPATGQQILQHGGAGTRLEVFLTPEVTLVESPVMICSHPSTNKAKGPEREVQAATVSPHEDAMASLFMKILDCEFNTAEDNDGNPFEQPTAPDQSLGCPLSALAFLPETTMGSGVPQMESLGSKCGYQSCLRNDAAPWEVKPALELQHIPSSSALSLHKSEGSVATTAQLSGYRCLGNLLSQPMAGSMQEWEPQLFPSEADQGQPWDSDSGGCSLESVFPESSLWLSSCEAATAPDFQLQQQAHPGATYQNIPLKPGAVSCLAVPLPAGYQSFSSALQKSTADAQQDESSLGLASPYKPFLSISHGWCPS